MSRTRLKPAAKFLIMIALAASLILSFIYLRPLIIPEGDKAQSVAGLMSGSNSPSTGNKCIEFANSPTNIKLIDVILTEDVTSDVTSVRASAAAVCDTLVV